MVESRTQSAQGFAKEPTEVLNVEEFVVSSSEDDVQESEEGEAA